MGLDLGYKTARTVFYQMCDDEVVSIIDFIHGLSGEYAYVYPYFNDNFFIEQEYLKLLHENKSCEELDSLSEKMLISKFGKVSTEDIFNAINVFNKKIDANNEGENIISINQCVDFVTKRWIKFEGQEELTYADICNIETVNKIELQYNNALIKPLGGYDYYEYVTKEGKKYCRMCVQVEYTSIYSVDVSQLASEYKNLIPFLGLDILMCKNSKVRNSLEKLNLIGIHCIEELISALNFKKLTFKDKSISDYLFESGSEILNVCYLRSSAYVSKSRVEYKKEYIDLLCNSNIDSRPFDVYTGSFGSLNNNLNLLVFLLLKDMFSLYFLEIYNNDFTQNLYDKIDKFYEYSTYIYSYNPNDLSFKDLDANTILTNDYSVIINNLDNSYIDKSNKDISSFLKYLEIIYYIYFKCIKPDLEILYNDVESNKISFNNSDSKKKAIPFIAELSQAIKSITDDLFNYLVKKTDFACVFNKVEITSCDLGHYLYEFLIEDLKKSTEQYKIITSLREIYLKDLYRINENGEQECISEEDLALIDEIIPILDSEIATFETIQESLCLA